MDMVVDEKLRIQSVGTYPSPFKSKTTFGFIVSQTADVSIKIYTSSGRLIKTFERVYTKVLRDLFLEDWDGTDDNGNSVANGVYYYKIIAENSSDRVTYKGKVARCR
jgi:flagellar hook assembly protein FlgD